MKKYSLLVLLALVSLSAAAQKIVLVEQFTNSGCPPCASAVPPVTTYVSNNEDKVIMIAYHASFPYLDSMYHENKVDNDAAVAYNQVGGVPYSVVNGTAYRGTTSDFGSKKETIIATELAKAITYELQLTNLVFENGRVSGRVVANALDTSLKNLVVKIALVERNVLKSSYKASPGKNSESEYRYVLRKMLPNFDGTSITQNNQLIDFDLEVTNAKNTDELRVVAFVQSTSTKEIYQAAWGNPKESITSSIANSTVQTPAFSLYPNPAKNELTIVATSTAIAEVAVLSIDGKVLKQLNLQNGATVSIADLPAGTYFVKAALINGSTSTQSFIKYE